VVQGVSTPVKGEAKISHVLEEVYYLDHDLIRQFSTLRSTDCHDYYHSLILYRSLHRRTHRGRRYSGRIRERDERRSQHVRGSAESSESHLPYQSKRREVGFYASPFNITRHFPYWALWSEVIKGNRVNQSSSTARRANAMRKGGSR